MKRILVAILFFCVLFAGAPKAGLPQPPPGCQVKNYADWNYTNVVIGWGGHDIDRPYQSLCGVAVQVNGQWHLLTEWNNTTVSFSDGTNAILFVNAAGVKGWDIRAPIGGHLDGSVVWDAIPGYTEAPNPRLYLPFQLKKWGVCDDGCVGPPPLPPTP